MTELEFSPFWLSKYRCFHYMILDLRIHLSDCQSVTVSKNDRRLFSFSQKYVKKGNTLLQFPRSLKIRVNVINCTAVKWFRNIEVVMFYLLLTWGGMWNNVSTWLTFRGARLGGARVTVVSRLIGGIQLHWQRENGSKCEKESMKENTPINETKE